MRNLAPINNDGDLDTPADRRLNKWTALQKQRKHENSVLDIDFYDEWNKGWIWDDLSCRETGAVRKNLDRTEFEARNEVEHKSSMKEQPSPFSYIQMKDKVTTLV